MTVEVTWNGVALAKDATVRAEQGVGRWFVELEQPMPVGTTLTLAGEVAGTVRVARVHEGLGAGMVVVLERAAEVVAAEDATAAAASSAMVAEGDPLDATGAAASAADSDRGGEAGDGGGDGDKKDANGNGHGRTSKRKRSRR